MKSRPVPTTTTSLRRLVTIVFAVFISLTLATGAYAGTSMALPAAATPAVSTTAASTADGGAPHNEAAPDWLIGKFVPGGTFYGKYPDGTCVLTIAPNQLTISESISGPIHVLGYELAVSNAGFVVLKTRGAVDYLKANCLHDNPSVGYLRLDRNVCQTSNQARCEEYRRNRSSPQLIYAFILTSFDSLEDASAATPTDLVAIQRAKGEKWREAYYVFKR